MPVSMPQPAASTPVRRTALVLQEGMEQAHGVGAAADAGDHRVRQPALALKDLRARLPSDDGLKGSMLIGTSMLAHSGHTLLTLTMHAYTYV